MKDRTIDYQRPDPGEAVKDIKTKVPSAHAAFEHTENFRAKEIASKMASLLKRGQAAVPEARDVTNNPTPEEYLHRQERMRKILGSVIGSGYGAMTGGFVGGQLFNQGKGFDTQHAAKGLVMGLLAGGTAGYTAGTILNKIKRYTGTHQPEPRQQTIQIVLPPSSQVTQQVEDAIKSGSAVAMTVGIFAGIKQSNVMGGPGIGTGTNVMGGPGIAALKPAGVGMKPNGLGTATKSPGMGMNPLKPAGATAAMPPLQGKVR